MSFRVIVLLLKIIRNKISLIWRRINGVAAFRDMIKKAKGNDKIRVMVMRNFDAWQRRCKEIYERFRRFHNSRRQRHWRQEERHHLHQAYDRHMELNKYHQQIRYFRPGILILNLAIWYFVYRFAGFKALSVVFAILISMGGLVQFFYLMRLEKRILKPISKLKEGVEEIARGNYDVRVERVVTNEIGLLVDSFNKMTQQLQESEKVKAEYEENRKMLIANISHDLKTPITSIQGYIEAILDGTVAASGNIDRYLQIIYRNSAYINKLVDDLFLFSKLDMQKLDFQFETINFGDFMDDLMEEFKFDFEEKKWGFKYSNRLLRDYLVRVDRKRINQVFKNIIENAVKYGLGKDLEIVVEVYARDRSVVAAIRDNGPGISSAQLPHIFDRFYRIDSERKKDLRSTGLGLSIARELVAAHGGEITVSSLLNQGSCFSVRLPFFSGEGDEPDEEGSDH